MGSISIALVDDHPLMLAGVVNLFEDNDDFTVVGKGATADDALQINRKLRPDVMVLDLFMPGNVFDVITEIVTKPGSTKVVAFTAMTGSDYAVRALNAGASGYILKGSSAEELIQGVRRNLYNARLCLQGNRSLTNCVIAEDRCRTDQAQYP